VAKGSVEARGETRIVHRLSSYVSLTSLRELASIWGHLEESKLRRRQGVADYRAGTKLYMGVLHGRMFMITRREI